MENGSGTKFQFRLKTNNCNDTLIFLINEFFSKSSLSSIEMASSNQDSDIANQMDILYRQLNAIEDLKTQFYNENQFNSSLNFSTTTFSQFNSKLNISNSKSKDNYFKRLFNNKSTMRNQKKILFKPHSNKTAGLSLTEANYLSMKQSHDSIQKTKEKGIVKTNGKEGETVDYKRNMNHTINYSRCGNSNSKNNNNQRLSFKFEPKKQILNNRIKSTETILKPISLNSNRSALIGHSNENNNQCFTPRNNNNESKHNHIISISHSKVDQLKKKITIESKIGKLMSDAKNEIVVNRIMIFLSIKNNSLKGINWLLRRIYLEQLLNQTKRKLSQIASCDNAIKDRLVQIHHEGKEPVSSLDNKMEIEILKYIETKVNEFLPKNEK